MLEGIEFLPSPAARFGRYEVVRRLGRGGMGDVLEGRHVELGTRVAIKVVRSAMACDPAGVRRVLREGRAAGAIRHPNVVGVLDVGIEQGTPYLVMELLEGEDLAGRLRRDAPLGVEEAADLLLPVVSGVCAAHDAGIVHRDLKPSNVFLARRHGTVEPVVVDFGISKSLSQVTERLTSSTFAGTPQYMAPEQLRGTLEVTEKSDQYTLAVLLYECITGGTPFYDDDYYELLRSIMTEDPVSPSELNPAVPRRLGEVLLRAMARDAGARFPSVRAFGAALLPFAGAETRRKWQGEFCHADPAASSGAPASRRADSWAGVVILAPAVFLAAVLGFVCEHAGRAQPPRVWQGSSISASRPRSLSPSPASPGAAATRADEVAAVTAVQRASSDPPAQSPALPSVSAPPPAGRRPAGKGPPLPVPSAEGPASVVELGTGNIPIVE